MRQIFRRIPLACSVGFPPLCSAAVARAGSIFRTQQGPVQGFQVRSAQDRSLRYLFLRRRARKRRARRPNGRALVCAPVEHLRARDADPPAARPLCVSPRFRADERRRRDDWRRHGRRHRRIEAPRRAAARRHAGRNRPCARPRARACIPIRHLGEPRATGGYRAPASRRCRCGSSKGWPNTCRSARSIRTRPCGCAMRPARKSCRRSRTLDSGEFFPYRWGQAVWAYIGGKYGDDLIGQIFRTAVRSGDPIEALKQAALIEDKELSANWHAAIREQYAPVMQATARAHTFGRSLTATTRRGWRRTCRRRSALTAATSSFSRRATCSRSISTWQTPRPDASSGSSSIPR